VKIFKDYDTVSSFCNIGKKTVWDVWSSSPNMTAIILFGHLSQTPKEITDSDMEKLERLWSYFTAVRTSQIGTVNAARRQLFSYGNRKLENIPPSRAALLQHVKCAAFQAGHVWGQALISSPALPSPSEWGWLEDSNGKWEPLWTTLAEASKGCRQLVKCS
jgi:hypothetical protein